MKATVQSKIEGDTVFKIMLGSEYGERRYCVLAVIALRKDAKFSSGKDNREWYDALRIGSAFTLKPTEQEFGPPARAVAVEAHEVADGESQAAIIQQLASALLEMTVHDNPHHALAVKHWRDPGFPG